ncbi:TetR/AcrR family transcriptional regulator [Clostridium sp. D53t1_180928_C8]|uniref:TetR/AcrR family transcriptional regulator n=1 Tax=Clostridium sp. D53t1_180928_C8 TaxID=2787101 RepID=UPI0018A8BD12|nr:TetR/AcrR family transcriptional regulator [Clostridium sp. D53t1_180928_C8]
MAGVKGNRRIIYTKKVIRDSLIDLLQDKDIHQITVTDICKKADINRGTFYTHYKDAFDLLESIEDELFNQIIEFIGETPAEEYINSLLPRVLELISENKALCKILFCRQKDNRILERILSVASMADFEKICMNSNEFIKSNMNYFIRYSVGGCISIIQAWLENDMPESPIELVNIINNINKIDTTSK